LALDAGFKRHGPPRCITGFARQRLFTGK